MGYKLLLYIHVLSTILSIGPFFVLFAVTKLLRLAKTEEQEQGLLGIFTFSIRLVKHAGHVLVVSGILLIIVAKWSWSTPWIVMTWVVMFGSIFFLARAFSPTIRRFAEPDRKKALLVDKLNRSIVIYVVLLLVMLWLMVGKPYFW